MRVRVLAVRRPHGTVGAEHRWTSVNYRFIIGIKASIPCAFRIVLYNAIYLLSYIYILLVAILRR